MADLEIDFLTERFQADQKSKSFFIFCRVWKHWPQITFAILTDDYDQIKNFQSFELNFLYFWNISIPKIRIYNELGQFNKCENVSILVVTKVL